MAYYDEAWKEALEHYLRWLLALLFPKVEKSIDWSEGYDSLQQQSHALLPEAETGNRYADKLIRVQTFAEDDERDARILAIEVQAQPIEGFERRVYVYHYRGDDCFSGPPEALVILADEDPKWKPTNYEGRLKYTRLTFEFEPAKLLDWRGREEELRQHENPMALFVLAHLESQRTRGDDEERANVKLALLLRVAQRKLEEEEERRHWHRFLGWLLPLPDALEGRVFAQATEHTRDKEKEMEFVSYMERKGEVKGLLAGIEAVLEVRFGADGLALLADAHRIVAPDRLASLLVTVKTKPLDEVRLAFAASLPGTNGTAAP